MDELRFGVGAAHMDEFAEAFARKVKLPVTNPAVLNRHLTVSEYVAQFRKASVRREIPGEYLDLPVEIALLEGNSTLRKLLVDARFAKQ
jgi:hypothetical protein